MSTLYIKFYDEIEYKAEVSADLSLFILKEDKMGYHPMIEEILDTGRRIVNIDTETTIKVLTLRGLYEVLNMDFDCYVE